MSDRPPMTVDEVQPFSRSLLGEPASISAIGTGWLGGKATGLVQGSRILAESFPDGTWDGIEVSVPRLVVLATDVFDRFMAQADLAEAAASEEDDERIAHAFQRADFPFDLVGDLRAIVETVRTPLAVRSSSLLEDATHEPFAGIYATKMIPNNQSDASTRFTKLIEAIKLVYASTYFRDARGYRERTGRDLTEEKMAVVIQEVVGVGHGERFYPTISGVARSWNYYPVGKARPDEGVIDLALGLGKTIVDGEAAWSLSPAHPKADPPFTIPQAGLAEAELDGSLDFVASTYVPESDRIVMGIGRKGPRVLNFAPVTRMDDVPLVPLVAKLVDACERGLGVEVEIDFALTLDPLRRDPPRLGFLQVRPIVVSREEVDLSEEELREGSAVVASTRVMGHGRLDTLTDVVYIVPETFGKEMNARIAQEIGEINRGLAAEGRDYALFTFGRLGSSDPWLGVPVDWGQISHARVVVEATTPEFDVELSQGAHFFHNMTSLGIFYFTVPHHGPFPIRWDWLAEQEVVLETEHVRHVRASAPLRVRVDGRRGLGVIEP